jgi:uncharacterized protein
VLSFELERIVVDTNVLVAALISATGTNRRVLRACLERKVQPILGETLFLEYEDVFGRTELMSMSPLSAEDRQTLLDAFLGVCEWVDVYFSWRPNLRDEGDNHIVELAVAGGASWIVTNNMSDFEGAELRFPGLQAIRPGLFQDVIE